MHAALDRARLMLERAREKRERLALPFAMPAERVRLIERNLDERVRIAQALVDACEHQLGSFHANFGGIDGIDAERHSKPPTGRGVSNRS